MRKLAPSPVKKTTSVSTEDLLNVIGQIRFNDVYDESRCPGLMGAMGRVLAALVESGVTGNLGHPVWNIVRTAHELAVAEKERVADELAEETA